jgi:sulfotransferase
VPTSDALRALAAIYHFIDDPSFAHDIEHVDYRANAFDATAGAGTPGLHAVRPQVKGQLHPTLLSPDLFRHFANDVSWRDPKLNPRDVRIV